MSYTLHLPSFEGPLDLLLRLIERAELEITSIAVAQVADQYLAHVRSMEHPDPRTMSEFLVLAARLLLIKSRALLPKAAPVAGEADPSPDMLAEELAAQLRAYQQFKGAAGLLRAWEDEGRRLFVRTAAPPPPPDPATLPLDVDLDQMLRALQRRIQLMLPLDEDDETLALQPRLTVRQAAERVRERLTRHPWFTFTDLLSISTTRQEVIVCLWAVLELLKRQAVVVEQDTLFDTISIGRGAAFSAPLEQLDEE